MGCLITQAAIVYISTKKVDIGQLVLINHKIRNIIRGTLLAHIWDIAVKKEILDHPDINYIITDCRFPNELNMIRDLHGIVIQVERGKKPDWWDIALNYNLGKFGASEPEELKNIHPSERDWIGINNPEHIFINDSSLEDLEKQVVDYFGLMND